MYLDTCDYTEDQQECPAQHQMTAPPINLSQMLRKVQSQVTPPCIWTLVITPKDQRARPAQQPMTAHHINLSQMLRRSEAGHATNNTSTLTSISNHLATISDPQKGPKQFTPSPYQTHQHLNNICPIIKYMSQPSQTRHDQHSKHLKGQTTLPVKGNHTKIRLKGTKFQNLTRFWNLCKQTH